VGLSVHSVDEIHANAPYVDYFHFGPVFATASKAAYGPPQGLKKLADAVAASAAVQRPLIAVGGIDPVNAQAVIDSGAAGIAVIGAVMRASDPRAAAATLLERITRRRA
jgi:thiamine-phosphate pyrophosphorylase